MIGLADTQVLYLCMNYISGRAWLDLLSLRPHAAPVRKFVRCHSATRVLLQESDAPSIEDTSAPDPSSKKKFRARTRPPSADELVEDVTNSNSQAQAKQRRAKLTTVPTREDLLALRPKPYEELTPPRKTTQEQRLKWYQKRFTRSVKIVAGAFTKTQLLALTHAVEDPLPKMPLKGVDKANLAELLVKTKKGWDWSDPVELYKAWEEEQERNRPKELPAQPVDVSTPGPITRGTR